jgi:hypothetical protein
VHGRVTLPCNRCTLTPILESVERYRANPTPRSDSSVYLPPTLPQERISEVKEGSSSHRRKGASKGRVGAAKGGRPRKGAESRNNIISIRITDEVKKKLDSAPDDYADTISNLIMENL